MASIFEQYPNLPGFATEFKDGGLKVRTEVPAPGTDSLLLLGTAIDGPVGEPIAIDPTTVEMIFGSATYPNGLSNGTTLVKAFYEAYQGGSRDIRLMRVTGSSARASIGTAATTERISKTVSLNIAETTTGNGEATVALEKLATESSINVTAGNSTLVKGTHYTTTTAGTGADAVITLKVLANKVKGGEKVIVRYQTGTGSSAVDKRAVITATGVKQDIKLRNGTTQHTADGDSVYLYVNGVEQKKGDVYTVDADKQGVSILPNKVDNGGRIEIRFAEVENKSIRNMITFESAFGGSVYNDTKVRVQREGTSGSAVSVIITKPESKKTQLNEEPLKYTSSDFPTFGQLVQAINADINNNILRASISNKHAMTNTADLEITDTDVPFEGGDNGLNFSRQSYFAKLGGSRNESGSLQTPGVYQLLENYTVDTIIPLGVYADEELPGKYDNFAAQLALACAYISHRNSSTNGVIATSSPDEAGLSAIQAHVEKLLKSKNDYYMRDKLGNILKDSEGNGIDLGRYISVVAGPDVVFNNARTGSYADNSAAGYGGFVAQLKPQSAPTNKAISYARSLRFNYSNAQLDKLTAARYVTLRYKNNGANVSVVDGPTAAQPTSDYRRVSTIRVVKAVTNELREVCDPYIGEANEIPQRNAMSAAISKRLGELVEEGVIVDYDFIIVVTPQMQIIGEASIELTVVPPMELRKITNVVALSPAI